MVSDRVTPLGAADWSEDRDRAMEVGLNFLCLNDV
jgi:hypothetical protein